MSRRGVKGKKTEGTCADTYLLAALLAKDDRDSPKGPRGREKREEKFVFWSRGGGVSK